MSQTITQKILARHCGKKTVQAGEFIWAEVDFTLGNDITAPIAIKEFEKIGLDKVFDNERVVLVPDHFTPNKDIKSAEQAKMLREFARIFTLVKNVPQIRALVIRDSRMRGENRLRWVKKR